jgi:AraC-like DNA-binding protein
MAGPKVVKSASPLAAMPPRNAPVLFQLTVQSWFVAARRCGFDLAPILSRAGIELDFVHLETATVDQARIKELMVACVASSRGEHFPFVLGQSFAFEYLPELQMLIRTSGSVRQALRVWDWVRALINPRLEFQLVEREHEAWVVYAYAGDSSEEAVEPYFAESMAAGLRSAVSLAFEVPIAIHRFRFRHAAPVYAADYARYLGAEVEFAASSHGFAFPRSVLDLPQPGAHAILNRQIEQRLARRFQLASGSAAPRSGLAGRVERILTAEPALVATGVGPVAKRLVLHPRTLQRRLHHEGDSFVALQARVRMRLASSWLAGEDTLEEISARLGFADRRSFTRAFTRWFGASPGAFRKRLAAPNETVST